MHLKILSDLEVMALNLHTCQLVIKCVCRSVFAACWSICVSCGVDVAWRSLLSDPISRPMLWCEGHCQETTTRQCRYSCPQCSLFSVAARHTDTLMRIQPNTSMCCVKWRTSLGKPPRVNTPGLRSLFKTNTNAYLLTVCSGWALWRFA